MVETGSAGLDAVTAADISARHGWRTCACFGFSFMTAHVDSAAIERAKSAKPLLVS